MPFVETARAGVLLERPELEALRVLLRCLFEKPGARAGIEAARIDIEMFEPAAIDDRESDDFAVTLGDPGFLAFRRRLG